MGDHRNSVLSNLDKGIMATPEEQYDDAMFAFTQEDYDAAIAQLRALLQEHPSHFDAQLALGMAFYRKGDYPSAIREGHVAEKLRPSEQLVHTNLSLFYMKSGDKKTAEHHGLQARIASWKGNMTAPAPDESDPELRMAQPAPMPTKVTKPAKFPDMPWKKSGPITPPGTPEPSSGHD
jgi:tetratricopeptide (TPR) repeat protein